MQHILGDRLLQVRPGRQPQHPLLVVAAVGALPLGVPALVARSLVPRPRGDQAVHLVHAQLDLLQSCVEDAQPVLLLTPLVLGVALSQRRLPGRQPRRLRVGGDPRDQGADLAQRAREAGGVRGAVLGQQGGDHGPPCSPAASAHVQPELVRASGEHEVHAEPQQPHPHLQRCRGTQVERRLPAQLGKGRGGGQPAQVGEPAEVEDQVRLPLAGPIEKAALTSVPAWTPRLPWSTVT